MMNKSRSQTIDFTQWKPSYGNMVPQKRKSIAHQALLLPHLQSPTPPQIDKQKTPLKQTEDHSSEKRKFSESIRRFQYLASLTTANIEEVGRAALDVLDGFSSVQNNFTELFIQIAQRLKAFCIYDVEFDIPLYKQLNSIHDSTGLLRNGLSLRNVAMGLIACYRTLEARKDQVIEAHLVHIKQQEEIIQGKNNMIGRLKERIQFYAADPARNLRAEYDELQQKYKQLEEELGDLYEKREDLSCQVEIRQKERDFYKKQVIVLKEVVDQLRQKIRIFQQTPNRAQQVLRKVEQYKDILDKIFIKVDSLAGELNSIKKQNQQLVSERAALVNRAAVQFDELTPRPNYEKALGRKLAFDSTQSVFERLMSVVSLDDTTVKEVFVKRAKNRARKAEQVRQEILNEVTEAKKDIQKFSVEE